MLPPLPPPVPSLTAGLADASRRPSTWTMCDAKSLIAPPPELPG